MLSGEKTRTPGEIQTTSLHANTLVSMSYDLRQKINQIEERLYGPQPEGANKEHPVGGGIQGSLEHLGSNMYQLSGRLDSILKRLGD